MLNVVVLGNIHWDRSGPHLFFSVEYPGKMARCNQLRTNYEPTTTYSGFQLPQLKHGQLPFG